MYTYDTRLKGCKNLPLNGWLFPCINCSNITSGYYYIKVGNCFAINCKKVYVPICSKCKKAKKEHELDDLDILKIKKIN